MTLHDHIAAAVRTAATQVFSTMLGVELGSAEVYTEMDPPQNIGGLYSFVGLAGSWVGTGSLACPPDAACRICSLFLATEAASVNGDVLDAVAEVTNMIIGNVKTELEGELGALGLSIPTVIYGKNFRARTGNNAEGIVVRYEWSGEPLVIKVCLARAGQTNVNSLPHGASASCAVDL